MLHELRVENLLLLDRAELRLSPGLNVLTGETGAGKTLLAQALDLLLGGRAGSGIVRGGAAEAYVEGVFSRPDSIPSWPSGCPMTLRRSCWPAGCGPTAAPAPTSAGGRPRSRTCAISEAAWSPSTDSTSTAS
jgi:energy-coupling factor transporter ATP-binding protein EcfA2